MDREAEASENSTTLPFAMPWRRAGLVLALALVLNTATSWGLAAWSEPVFMCPARLATRATERGVETIVNPPSAAPFMHEVADFVTRLHKALVAGEQLMTFADRAAAPGFELLEWKQEGDSFVFFRLRTGWPLPALGCDGRFCDDPERRLHARDVDWNGGVGLGSDFQGTPRGLPLRPQFPGFVANALIAAVAILLVARVGSAALSTIKAWRVQRMNVCKECGYSRCGLPAGSPCPECGGAPEP